MISAGTRLGRYEISRQLGAGGMGEVYLAQDTLLRRPAALKILPAEFTESEDRLRRFVQESCAASALNHPNIITIHEIGQEDSLHFMAMEFVEGETLRAQMMHTRKSLKEALDISVQVAEALAAAHAAGIVHRDIKPENIMVRPDGYVKVLDFGLAKLTESQSAGVDTQAPTMFKVETDPGTVMGTMQYMSPEQARGLDVDKRTDIWSLGCVLYEMLAGRSPFTAKTRSDVMVAVLAQEPPPLAQQARDVPAELERIVRKALRKDREERYQTIKDMALDLKSLRRDIEVGAEIERSQAPSFSGGMRATESGAHNETATSLSHAAAHTSGIGAAQQTSSADSLAAGIRQGRRGMLLLVVALAVTAGLAFGLYKYFGLGRTGNRRAGLFRQINATKLTNNGNTKTAAISPDGKYVVYAMDEGGKQSLWMRQVAIASNVRLTPLASVNFFACAFSPDGNFIYYALEDGMNPPAIYKIPVLGGSPTRLLGDMLGPAIPSPDGKQVGVVTIDKDSGGVMLSIRNIDGTGERTLTRRKAPEFFDWFAWSRDGSMIACAINMFDGHTPSVKVIEIRVADGTERVVTTYGWLSTDQLAWLPDNSGILLTAKDQESPFEQIWLVSYPEGEVRKITSDLNDYTGLSISDDSSSLVTVQYQRLSTVWLTGAGKENRTLQVTPGAGTYYDLAVTPDGKLLYSSDASGSADIWEMETDGTNQRQLTAGAGRNYGPAASPDNRYIVFHSNRSGLWQIWRMDRDGSNPVQLTKDNAESNWPQFSPDGQWIIYTHLDTKLAMTLWKVPIGGGTPTQLNDKPSLRPVISPDGKTIACWQFGKQRDVPVQISIIPIGGGEPVKSFAAAASVISGWDAELQWTPDGSAVAYLDRRGGVDNIWSQPLTGGPPRQLTDFKDSQIFSFDWLRDGRLVCSRGMRTGDAVLLRDSQ
ncbi:MAG TPA: protein kinase [Pyrinomonadaceae bacterium]|jgi:serine/threonine protein kinase/Tol biopolymer transport system component